MGSFSFKGLLGAVALCLLTTPAMAILSNLTPTDDGDIRLFSSTDINTTRDRINVSQSGQNIRNGILEFDLSSIADGSTINSFSIDFTLADFTSNTGGSAEIDIFAFAGDGVITEPDFSAAGTQVFDGTVAATGLGFSNGGTTGDVISLVLSDLSVFEGFLPGNLMTLRIETDSFAIFRFASLENQDGLNPATLNIDFTPGQGGPVPAPAMAALFAGGLGLLGLAGWRRRQLDAD